MKRMTPIAWVLVILAVSLSACGAADEEAIQASGFLEARIYRVVSFSEGRVESVEVNAGDEVEQGQILVALALDDLEAQYQAAAAGLASAEASLDRLEGAPTESEVAQLTAVVEAAQVDLLAADEALDQLEEAYGDGEPPERRLFPVQSAVDMAQAAVDLAQANLDQALAGARSEELQIAQAAVDAAAANLEMAEVQLELARGVSPVDGVVQQVGPQVGELVSPGSLIAAVADTNELFIVVYLGQEQTARIEYGDEAEVRVDAFPDEVFEGEVSWIADEAQFTPTTVQTEEERVALVFAVRIEVDNAGGVLIAGLPADVTILP